ncbi:MAG: hypothetical protein JWO15_1571 [Sphingomonadales bacterium]|nr:hypothetical protein [Sphingomonadales bacterium]
MSNTDKVIVDDLILEQRALLDRCEKLGLHWVVVKMSIAIDELEKLKLPINKS